MNEIKTIELQLAGWQKSDSHGRAPMVHFILQTDEDVEWFERFTAAKSKGKNHIAGQIFDAAFSLSEQDEQEIPPEQKGGPLSKSAAIISKTADFQFFVIDKLSKDGIQASTISDASVNNYIRNYCGVDSRAEIDHKPGSAKLFSQLMAEYREWLGDVRV